MKYSKATNYALHTMVQLALVPKGNPIGVQTLAKHQDLSPTYLAKILGKLTKGNLIYSTPGVNGGYQLAKSPETISFFDVIQLIEGQAYLFHCTLEHNEKCLIENVMVEAEMQMAKHLSQTSILDIAKQLEPTLNYQLKASSLHIDSEVSS